MSRIDGNDVLIIAGMIFIGYGLYLIQLPWPPLIVGFILMILGAIGAWRKGQSG